MPGVRLHLFSLRDLKETTSKTEDHSKAQAASAATSRSSAGHERSGAADRFARRTDDRETKRLPSLVRPIVYRAWMTTEEARGPALSEKTDFSLDSFASRARRKKIMAAVVHARGSISISATVALSSHIKEAGSIVAAISPPSLPNCRAK